MTSLRRFESEQGWILHRRAWRESSLLLELFSLEHGRVGLVGKGLRGQSSPWRGLGEPFMPLRSVWVRRTELGTLTDIEAVGDRVMLAGQALWCGLYANELVLTLIDRDEPVPAVFRAYGALLSGLRNGQGQHESLRRFELALLGSLGVAPDFDRDALSGEPVRAEAWYRLDPECGFVAADSDHGTYSGKAIISLSGSAGDDPALRRQAREIMRKLIDHQLDGRTLKTRELFRSVR